MNNLVRVPGLVLLCLLGCQPTGSQSVSMEELEPATVPGTEAKLILAGTEVPVQLKSEKDASLGEITFSLLTHGEILEAEKYVLTTSSFSLASAAGEAYVPPIPLLKKTFSPGDQWAWSGHSKIQLPGITPPSTSTATPARANVTVAADTLNLAGGQHPSYRVDVLLEIDDGSPKPMPRKLQFWFVKGKGILKREFAMSSTRIPVAPKSEEP